MDYYAFHCLISTKNGARTASRYFAEICRQHENVDFAETWLATAYCKIPEAALARSIIIKKLEYSPSSPTWINLWLLLLVAEGKRKQEIALVHQLERALVPQLESARRKKDSTLHLSEWTQRAGESSLRYKLEDLYTSLTATQQIIGDKESALRLSLCSSALAKEPEKAEPIQRLQQENAYFVNATELTKGIPNEKIIDHLYRTLLKRSASKAEQTRWDIVRKEAGVEEVGHRIQISIEFATLYQRERPIIPEDTDVVIAPKDQRTMDMIVGRLAPE